MVDGGDRRADVHMGNSLGCAGLGERLAAAARDGDAAEVRRLLEANPGLARCATFGNLNSPLHLAAAKGHHEIAELLLENGADVNGRNIYGQVSERCQLDSTTDRFSESHELFRSQPCQSLLLTC